MALDDIVNKAKQVASDANIDKAAEAVKKVTPDDIDAKVDQVADKLKDMN